MSASKTHNGNPPLGETPIPPLYDGWKALCECARCGWKTRTSKHPFGIREDCLWTLFPLLSTYPMVLCWGFVVHLLFWLPLVVFLAVYGVQNSQTPQNTSWASQFLNRLPPKRMFWWLCFASFVLTLATQLIFITAWYTKRRAMNHFRAYQSSENCDSEKTFESRVALDRGWKDLINTERLNYTSHVAIERRYFFVGIGVWLVGLLTSAIISILLVWTPHLFRYLILRIYDAIIPPSVPTTRVEDWLQQLHYDLWLIPTLVLFCILNMVLPFFLGLPTGLISGAYRWKDEVQEDTVSLPHQN